MLKQLLKYEFKATSRLYSQLYLALLALPIVLGIFVRIPSLPSSTPLVLLMIIYVALIIAVIVLTIATVILRFTNNLLGREGYLMHTLPVTSWQLILSKLLAGIVWSICSVLVLLASVYLFVLIGSMNLSQNPLLTVSDIQRIWSIIFEILHEFGGTLLMMLLCTLSHLICIILSIYAACMVGHQFKRCSVPASIIAFFGFTIVQNWLQSILPSGSSNLTVSALNISISSTAGTATTISGSSIPFYYLLAVCLFNLALSAFYFVLTNWLMKYRLNLE